MLLYLLYFLSGVAGIIYEVVFARALGHLLGVSMLSNAVASGFFLLGLAAGALAGGKLTVRWSLRKPAFWWRAFALAELLVALLGLMVPVLLSAPIANSIISAVHISNTALSYVLRVLEAAVFILPASTCMGATFPFAVQATVNRLPNCSQWLYGINTLGGAVGAILGGFIFLPALGLQTSAAAAACMDAVVALTAFACAGRHTVVYSKPSFGNQLEKTLSSKQSENQSKSLVTLAIVATICGATSLSLQVCWVRFFSLILGSSSYSLSVFLSVFLLGTALGSLIVARFLQRLQQPFLIAAGACLLASVSTLISVYTADKLPWMFIVLVNNLRHLLSNAGPPGLFFAAVGARWILVAAVVLVPSLFFGMVLPLLFTLRTGPQSEKLPSWLYSADALGALAGSLLTAFLIVPRFAVIAASGIQCGILLNCFAWALLGFFLLELWCKTFIEDRSTRVLVNLLVGFVVVASSCDVMLFQPIWRAEVMTAGPSLLDLSSLERIDERRFLLSRPSPNAGSASALLFYREGLNSTISVDTDRKLNLITLRSDGKVEAALPLLPSLGAANTDISTHKLLGILPLRFHQGPCKKVLLIGLGTGTTGGAILSDHDVSKLRIAEIEPAVDAACRFFSVQNGNPLSDPRVSLVENDGRYVLASENEKYDAIVCQPSDPWVIGSSELFSKEFFELCKQHLDEGGVMSQWIQLYSIEPKYLATMCRTFQSVFPNAALFHQQGAGECILLGGTRALPINLSPAWGATWLSSKQLSNMRRPNDLSGRALNTDDNLLIEFKCADQAMTRHDMPQQIRDNIDLIQYAKQ